MHIKHFNVYCGKSTEAVNEYYIQGKSNYIKYLVQKLSQHHNLTGRNITKDCLYTNFEIANWLLDNKITMLGTMQSNRVGIPAEVKESKNKDLFSSVIFLEKDGSTNILRYTVTTSKGKK